MRRAWRIGGEAHGERCQLSAPGATEARPRREATTLPIVYGARRTGDRACFSVQFSVPCTARLREHSSELRKVRPSGEMVPRERSGRTATRGHGPAEARGKRRHSPLSQSRRAPSGERETCRMRFEEIDVSQCVKATRASVRGEEPRDQGPRVQTVPPPPTAPHVYSCCTSVLQSRCTCVFSVAVGPDTLPLSYVSSRQRSVGLTKSNIVYICNRKQFLIMYQVARARRRSAPP